MNINFKDNYLNEDWTWHLTSFERLNYTSMDILACIEESNIIGMGGVGKVYKVEMSNGEMVAMKKLFNIDQENIGFLVEVDVLRRLRHRNIVRLLGYCYNYSNPMLIYEFK